METYTAWFGQSTLPSDTVPDVPFCLLSDNPADAVTESKRVWATRVVGGQAGFRIYSDRDGRLIHEEAFASC
jgi:hypothetical protein